MAQPSDTTFGAGFDATAFRAAVRSTMTMGLPNATADRATFRWQPLKTYKPEDPDHNPYNWTSAPVTDIEHPDVLIPVAIEFTARPAASRETVIGELDTSRAIVTVLDEDYELIRGANEVLLGGDTYTVQFVAPPIGLFSVTILQLYCVAQDES